MRRYIGAVDQPDNILSFETAAHIEKRAIDAQRFCALHVAQINR